VCDRDRYRYIVARSRLRQLIGARLDVRPDLVELEYGACGKPSLAKRFAAAAGSNLRFSLAHAGDVTMYVFSCGREIGVDIEAVRPIDHAENIAAHFFSR